MSIVLDTPRLILRLPQPGDLPTYAAYCASDRAHFVGGPFSGVQAFEKLAAMIGHWTLRGYGRFVMTDRASGTPVGHVGLLHLDPGEPAEMTWSLWHAECEGRGLAGEGAAACLANAFGPLGLARVLARIAPDNHASVALAHRLGGRPCPEMAPPPWFADAQTFAFTRP